ncbi:MAG TPA: hypothetical protein VFS67_13375 [Polyangiaceae bacterium]|nr:hypothetical protein [Polyangiaceae bacterium]
MKRSCSVAILLLWSGGLACGSVKPLGLAAPREETAEPALEPTTDSMAVLPVDSSADAAGDAAWRASSEPLYVLTTRVSTTSGATHSFLLTAPSLEPEASFDLRRAVQLDTESPAFGVRGQPFVYTAAESQPTLLRWHVLEDGSLQQSSAISFSSAGLRRLDAAASLSFFASDKAYFCNRFDPSSIVIWNPETLEVRGTIELDLPVIGQMLPQVVLSQRADRLFAIVSWQQSFSTDWTRFGDHVQLIAIDTASDQIVSRVDEPRCNLLSASSSGSDGAVYFSPSSYYAPLRSMLGAARGVDDCALRIQPGSERFEPGYTLDLAALTGGRPAGDVALVSSDTAFLRVWHADLVTPLSPDGSNWESVLQEPGFSWWIWRLGAEQAEPIAEQKPSKDAQLFVVDGTTYTAVRSEDGSASVLEQLDPGGVLRPALSGPGEIYGVLRLR